MELYIKSKSNAAFSGVSIRNAQVTIGAGASDKFTATRYLVFFDVALSKILIREPKPGEETNSLKLCGSNQSRSKYLNARLHEIMPLGRYAFSAEEDGGFAFVKTADLAK